MSYPLATPLPRRATTASRITALPRAVEPPRRKYCVHGVPVELGGAVELLGGEVERWLGAFAAPVGFGSPQTPVVGLFRRYEQHEVLRHLSPNAVRLAMSGLRESSAMELYQEGERFWLVDDRWGMAELNLLKGTWRSWLLPRPTVDPVRCGELAMLWPLAQILRGRGLSLLPAASVERDGVGALVVSPFGIDAELAVLSRNGFRVIGQRWSVLRESEGRVEVLELPGRVGQDEGLKLLGGETSDLPGPGVPCEAVVVVESARRAAASVKALPSQVALDVLRRAWPIVEVPRGKRQWSMKLAVRCPCHAAELSRRAEDLYGVLTSIRSETASEPAIRRFVPALVRA